MSACSKGGGYNLKNLSNDFYSVAAEEDDDIIVKDDNKIKFDYSKYVYNQETYVVNAITTYDVYKNLNNYNTLYENIMSFAFNFVELCSNNEVEIEKEIKNSLENKLTELKSAIKDVAICTDLFAGILKTTSDEVKATDSTCLHRFETLLTSYEKLFEKATYFNAELSNVYFNHLLTNSNPNVSDVTAAAFDVSVVVNNLNARKHWQISNLSTAFAEMYINGSNIAHEIIEGGSINLNPTGFEYSTLVSSISVLIDEAEAIQVAGGENKLAFYQASKKAYSAQEMINNDNAKYISACKNVKYAIVEAEDTTSVELLSVEIIDAYSDLLLAYNNVLIEMLNLIEV